MKRFLVVVVYCLVIGSLPAIEKQNADLQFYIDVQSMVHFYNIQNRNSFYTTQPIENKEFVLNQAYVQGSYTDKKFRGQLALHAGSYVDVNYAAEPQIYRNLLRANGGFQVAEETWVDVGIFDSHIGMESGISRDNPTYTRSLIADLSPFYESGLSVSHERDKWLFKALILNGWQRIKDNNKHISVGSQVQYKPGKSITINSSTIAGNETAGENRPRIFHDLYILHDLTNAISYAIAFDTGAEKQSGSSRYNEWFGTAFVLRYKFSSDWASAFRLEYYNDRHQVIVSSNSSNGFQTTGASINIDWQPIPQALCRLEVRWLNSRDAIFQDGNGASNNDAFFVLSSAFTF